MKLEKEMATHSNMLAWEIPQTEEAGCYSPRGSRVGHNLSTKQQHLIEYYTAINYGFSWWNIMKLLIMGFQRMFNDIRKCCFNKDEKKSHILYI